MKTEQRYMVLTPAGVIETDSQTAMKYRLLYGYPYVSKQKTEEK